jgi:hypothetical protein
MVGMVIVSATGCDDGREPPEGAPPPRKPTYQRAELEEVRKFIEPSLREIDIELERLTDEIESNGKRALVGSHRRDLRDLRKRIGRLRVRMEVRRTHESERYRGMREETTARLQQYIDQIEVLEAKVGAAAPSSGGTGEADAGQGA